MKYQNGPIRAALSVLLVSMTSLVLAQDGETPSESKSFTAGKQYVEEISTLAKKPVIVSAFKYIMQLEPETRQNLITLTEIPAPPYKEQKRAAKFMEMVKAIGVDSLWVDQAGNVIALKKGKNGKKKVVLEGHLDTVFPDGTDVTVKEKGDTLMAPGIGDDTRGLAVLLAVMKSMKQANVKTEADVYFVGTVGEEGLGDLRGVKQLFESGLKIDSYIAIDGGGIGGITTGAVGSHRYQVKFKGPGGHSYGAFGLANPHNASARAVYYFIKDADAYTRTPGEKTTYNVGVVGGGTSVNAIPFESWMEVDMRSESPQRLAAVDTLLQKAISKALAEENQMKRSGKDLTVEVKLMGDRPSGGQEATVPLIQKAMASATFLGAAPNLSFSSTNSNIPISKGIPAVTIGKGGRGGGAHALNEWWVNDQGHLAIENALLILVSEAGLAK